jgi:hypothetical protein
LIPIGGIWAGEWPGYANDNIGMSRKSGTKTTNKQSSKRGFYQSQ